MWSCFIFLQTHKKERNVPICVCSLRTFVYVYYSPKGTTVKQLKKYCLSLYLSLSLTHNWIICARGPVLDWHRQTAIPQCPICCFHNRESKCLQWSTSVNPWPQYTERVLSFICMPLPFSYNPVLINEIFPNALCVTLVTVWTRSAPMINLSAYIYIYKPIWPI